MQSTADIIFEIDLQLRFVSVFGRGLKTLKMEPPAFIGKQLLISSVKMDEIENKRTVKPFKALAVSMTGQ